MNRIEPNRIELNRTELKTGKKAKILVISAFEQSNHSKFSLKGS